MTTITEKRPKGGAPRRYSVALADKICGLAAAGLTYDEIERAAGISRGAIYYWLRADDARLPEYQGFRKKFYEARATGYVRKWGVPPDPPAGDGRGSR
jgi:hypothetical protein